MSKIAIDCDNERPPRCKPILLLAFLPKQTEKRTKRNIEIGRKSNETKHPTHNCVAEMNCLNIDGSTMANDKTK